MGSYAGGTEVNIGVHKSLGDGVSAGVGVGTSSHHGSVYLGKSVDVNDHVRVGMSASFDGTRAQAGPGITLHNEGYGMGLTTFGPSVLINNVSIPVGPTGPANLVVTGIVGAYKAITGKTRAEIEGLKATIEGLKASQQLAVQDREVWESRYEALSVKYQSLQSQHDEMMSQVRLLLVRTAPSITPLPPIATPAGR